MKKSKDRGVKPLKEDIKPKDTCVCPYCGVDVGKPANLCGDYFKCPNMTIQPIV